MKSKKDYPSFFEKEDFFNDFEKQLKGLGIANKIDLYEGLRFLANTFKLPDLKQ